MRPNVNNFYTRFQADYLKIQHKERLNEINKRNLPKISASPALSVQSRLNSNRAFIFKQKQIFKNIHRENKVLANKLSDQYAKRPRINLSYPKGPISLNITERKRRADQINTENKRLVRKLSATSSQLSFKNLKKHINFHNDYRRSRKNLWRNTRAFSPVRSKSTLPRLNSHDKKLPLSCLPKYYQRVPNKNSVQFFVDNVKKFKIAHQRHTSLDKPSQRKPI